MILVDFVYDKENGETPHKRFLAVTQNDDMYVTGYELISYGQSVFKNFLKNRIVGDIHSYGSFNESELRSAKIIPIDKVFDVLDWNDDMQEVYRELGGDADKLCQLVRDKLDKKIYPLRDNLFLLLENTAKVFNIVDGYNLFTMKVTLGVVEFYQGMEKLTPYEFTKRLLGL